tara:strand:+ start:844 stop:1341 length:498 start_codon:yes stop_codon:yes gene_type:complete
MFNIKDIKIFIVDCDGCLTDGSLYYTEAGKYMKKFNSKDGLGLMQVKQMNIVTGIVTGDSKSFIAEKRGEHLKLDFVKSGIGQKDREVEKILKEYNLEWKNLAYFGDDLNDLETIKKCGLSFSPNDGHKTIKEQVDIVCKLNGGFGSVREACDLLTNNTYFGDIS